MKDVPENELLSAYLDGELTAAEQAKVERLLAGSPAARQLLDELRALSATLRTMPQYKLGEDISEQVLRLAERQILTERLPPAEPAPAARPSVLRRVLNPRVLLWPAAAAAVALLLMVTGPRQPEPDHREEVALAPKAAEAPSETPSTEAAAGAIEEAEETEGPAALKDGRIPAPQKPGLAPHVSDGPLEGPGKAGREHEAKAANRDVDGVVLVDLTAHAARERAFDQLLHAKGIAWDETQAKADLLAANVASADAAGVQKLALKLTEPQQREEEKQPSAVATLAKLAEAGRVDLVWVEAPAGQIEATLVDLEAQSDTYVSLLVEPASRLNLKAQQKWRNYSRLGRQQRAAGEHRQVEPTQTQAGPELPSQHEASAPTGPETSRRGRLADKARFSQGRAWRAPVPSKELNAQLRSLAGTLHGPGLDRRLRGALGSLPAAGESGRAATEVPPPPGERDEEAPAPTTHKGEAATLAEESDKEEHSKTGKHGRALTGENHTPSASSRSTRKQPAGAAQPRPSVPAARPMELPASKSAQPPTADRLTAEFRAPVEQKKARIHRETPSKRRMAAQEPTVNKSAARSEPAFDTEQVEEPKRPAIGQPAQTTGGRQVLKGGQLAVPGGDAGEKSDAPEQRRSSHQRGFEESQEEAPTYLMLFVLRVEPDGPDATSTMEAASESPASPAPKAARAPEQ